MSTETTRGPSEIGPEAKQTDVTDEDELREEMLRILEDSAAGDLDAMEGRFSHLLSDTRRAKAERGGDDECPHCGGRTSGEGVTCADCRRVGNILNEDMDGRDPVEVTE